MARTLDSTFQNALDDATIFPFLAAKVEWPSGTIRGWTGYGDISIESETYSGLGTFLNFTQAQETEELKANNFVLTLSGVDTNLVGTSLTDSFQGMNCEAFLGLLDESGDVISQFLMFKGFADTIDVQEDGETSILSLNIESRLITMEKASRRRYTNEDQKENKSGDTSLRFINGLIEKEIAWGRESSVMVGFNLNNYHLGGRY